MAREDRLRMQIALEAARIMAEQGINDHGLAKKKAAVRMGISETRNMPRVEEIDAALIQHHRLFGDADQPMQLARLRKLALEAMRFLAEFSPVLVGGVWNGGAGKFSPIRLHLFPHAPEDVIRKLLEAHIPFEEKSHSLAHHAEILVDQPALHFYVDATRVELLLLPPKLKGRSKRKKGEQQAEGSIRDLEKLIMINTSHIRQENR